MTHAYAATMMRRKCTLNIWLVTKTLIFVGCYSSTPLPPQNEVYTKQLEAAQDCFVGALPSALLNFTDLSDEFCCACGEAGLIHFLVEMIKEAKTSVLDSKVRTKGVLLLKVLMILPRYAD